MYLDLSVFTSSPISLVAATRVRGIQREKMIWRQKKSVIDREGETSNVRSYELADCKMVCKFSR
jgi:hypothetical protein